MTKLTPQQSAVLALVVQGLSNKEVGVRLGKAENTVELHMTQLMRKFKVESRSRLIAKFWMRSLEVAVP